MTRAKQIGRQLTGRDLDTDKDVQKVLRQERELYELTASLGMNFSNGPTRSRPKISDRVVRIDVFHRLPLTVFSLYGDTNYRAAMWVRAWTGKGYRVEVADIASLNTDKVDEKIRMISQLFQEVVGKEISFVRRGKKDIYLVIDPASLPRRLQKVNLYNYMELKRLWRKRFGK